MDDNCQGPPLNFDPSAQNEEAPFRWRLQFHVFWQNWLVGFGWDWSKDYRYFGICLGPFQLHATYRQD